MAAKFLEPIAFPFVFGWKQFTLMLQAEEAPESEAYNRCNLSVNSPSKPAEQKPSPPMEATFGCKEKPAAAAQGAGVRGETTPNGKGTK
jgi:hypothetical protein